MLRLKKEKSEKGKLKQLCRGPVIIYLLSHLIKRGESLLFAAIRNVRVFYRLFRVLNNLFNTSLRQIHLQCCTQADRFCFSSDTFFIVQPFLLLSFKAVNAAGRGNQRASTLKYEFSMSKKSFPAMCSLNISWTSDLHTFCPFLKNPIRLWYLCNSSFSISASSLFLHLTFHLPNI